MDWHPQGALTNSGGFRIQFVQQQFSNPHCCTETDLVSPGTAGRDPSWSLPRGQLDEFRIVSQSSLKTRRWGKTVASQKRSSRRTHFGVVRSVFLDLRKNVPKTFVYETIGHGQTDARCSLRQSIDYGQATGHREPSSPSFANSVTPRAGRLNTSMLTGRLESTQIGNSSSNCSKTPLSVGSTQSCSGRWTGSVAKAFGKL